jgi:hypothetical protein
MSSSLQAHVWVFCLPQFLLIPENGEWSGGWGEWLKSGNAGGVFNV